MKLILALTVAVTMAFSAPAFAQSVGSPGAAPVGSGSNPPGSGVEPNVPHTDMNGTNEMKGNANGMYEGRAAVTTTPSDAANPAPETVRGDQNKQDMAK